MKSEYPFWAPDSSMIARTQSLARTPAKPTRASTQLDPEVEKWLDKHAIATGKSDMNLVVTEGDAEIFVPVSKAILAVNSGLVRGLPDSDDVPIIGDHDARTVVQYVSLCYPRLAAPVPTFSLTDITKLTRLAHWLDSPEVIDLLFGQLKAKLDGIVGEGARVLPTSLLSLVQPVHGQVRDNKRRGVDESTEDQRRLDEVPRPLATFAVLLLWCA